MDQKYKQVTLLTSDYQKLKERAKKNHRTLSGELTHILTTLKV